MSTYFKYLKSYYSYTFLLKAAFFISVIISVIDYLNLPTEYLKNLDSRVIILLSISLVFILFLISIELHLFDIFKLESINIIDMLLMLIIFSSLLYSIAATVLSIFHVYKIVSISLLLVFTIPILFERIKSFKNTFILQTEYKSNVLDLKQIYDNNFEITDDIPILIEEKDVDYDLLNRSRTINLLYTSILNCNPTTSFVISLEGKWGSGKTTIINNTKNLLNKPEHENIVIIDDLDPWSYETPESLFNSMFERILNQSNINFNAFETTQMINTAYMEIFTDKKINALKNFIFPTGNLKNVKDKINDQLKFSNKKVVFFIDNIDRTENENIILLFKLVANILDFERVVYVLSFDNERVESILKHDLKLDYAYLKKIIQMQIRVPQTDNKSYLEIFEKSISNILMKFGESPQSIYTTHSDLINFMATNTTDLRDFKRFINSALSFSYKTISYLNKRDLLTMEYIRLNNINLYEIIYKNPNYFVSHDRDQNKFGEITPFFDKPGFEIEIKSFYDELFGSPENNPYQNLLKNLFPYVDNYVKNQKYRSNSSIVASDISFESIAKGRNICSQKFFPLYFDYTSNEYIYISETLDL
ncbi:MAG: P-loop NTPase fold protein, partial [Planococcus donghaensis]